MLPAAVFAALVVLLGGAGVCAAPSTGCDMAIGATLLGAAPLGAALFWSLSGVSAARRASPGTATLFGRKGRGRGTA